MIAEIMSAANADSNDHVAVFEPSNHWRVTFRWLLRFHRQYIWIYQQTLVDLSPVNSLASSCITSSDSLMSRKLYDTTCINKNKHISSKKETQLDCYLQKVAQNG